MGCDIHAFIEERRIGSEDKFWWFASVEINRNYQLFALMAGVRYEVERMNGFTPISTPKGLPDDVGFHVQGESESWEGDGHSHSWLTLDELEKVERDYGAILSAPTSWYQHPDQAVPDSATRIEKNAMWGMTYVEVGERTPSPVPYDLKVVIATMRALKDAGRECRLVFWFDN